VFYLIASSHCPCLWEPSFAHLKRPDFGFSLAFGHLGELFVFSSSSISFTLLSFVGVDNALIKGKIANTRLICALVIWICDE
jgi:hypothetical protein